MGAVSGLHATCPYTPHCIFVTTTHFVSLFSVSAYAFQHLKGRRVFSMPFVRSSVSLAGRAVAPGGLPKGSDIHVMLALCCRSCQVVMANEELNGTDMVSE